MEEKLKFLEMIQGVITRMANNSFLLKGWAVTLVSAMFALSGKDADSRYFLIACAPTVLFWFLDSYYLQLERKYRKLYNLNIGRKNDEIDFRLSVLPANRADKTCYWQSLCSPTEAGFYIPLAALVALVAALVPHV